MKKMLNNTSRISISSYLKQASRILRANGETRKDISGEVVASHSTYSSYLQLEVIS